MKKLILTKNYQKRQNTLIPNHYLPKTPIKTLKISRKFKNQLKNSP
jgi:hypothetical protein